MIWYLAFLAVLALASRVFRAALGVADANALVAYVTTCTTPVAVTGPCKVSLHTGDPGTTGANEAAGGTYARQTPSYSAPSGGAAALSATVSFTGLAAGTYTHFGYWDSAGTPKWRMGSPLATPQTVPGGATINVTSATLSAVGS